jgi:hypothetical protein
MKRAAPERKGDGIYSVVNILMLVLLLPVLFSVFFIGNKFDYWDDVKAAVLLPNAFLTIVAAAVSVGSFLFIRWGGRNKLNKKTSEYMNIALIVLFVLFYYFCMWISGEIVFDMSVDQGIVREAAKDVAHKIPFGYQFTFSMNYNNLPITYVLGILYRIAENWTWFGHNPEYLWVITGCMLVSLAGFVICLTVKKITGNPAAVLVAYVLYFSTAGISPWKGMPYTDSYGILFPVLCIYLYICSMERKTIIGRTSMCFLSLLAGVAGGFMKPSCYIAVLAVLAAQGISLISELIKNTASKKNNANNVTKYNKYDGITVFIISVIMACALYKGADVCMDFIIEDIGLDYNEEIEATPQYFFFMGTKELTTGGFSTEDYGVFGEFQFSKADRNAACLERAWERISERGFFGTMYFCLKKLVKSFNDGTFAWTYVLYYEPFPENLTHDNALANLVRSMLNPLGEHQAWYDTIAEFTWILTLIGVPLIVLTEKKKDIFTVFSVLVAGVLIYLMLFESGARYVYVFLPAFIIMNTCGMDAFSQRTGQMPDELFTTFKKKYIDK